MGVLELTANMKLFELKKSKLQTAMRTLMLEWEHMEEYMESTQYNFQKCLDELHLKEKKLISVQESIEEKFEQIELKAEKLAVKQQSVEGIFKKIKVEEKRVEDILKYVEERTEELNSKETQLEKRSKELDCVQDGIERRVKELDAREIDIEKRCKELDSKEKELGDRAREIESREKQIGLVDMDNGRAQKRNKSRLAHSALMRKLRGFVLVPGEVEAPPAVVAPAQKRSKNVRNKRAASSSILAAPKRTRSVKLEYDEEGDEVQVTREMAVNEVGQDNSTQGREASDDERPLSFRMAVNKGGKGHSTNRGKANKGGKDYSTQRGEASEDDEENSTQRGEASEDDEENSTQRGEASDDDEENSTQRGEASEDDEENLTQRGSASEDDKENSTQRGEPSKDSVPLSFSIKVDPEVVQKIIPEALNHDLPGTSNARSPPHLENTGFAMGEFDNKVGSLIELDKKFQDSFAESAKKLNAKVLDWEAKFSKIQAEINKAGKLLTELNKNRI